MLTGWWGNREETRFDMKHSVELALGADAYRISNPPPNLVASHKAGLEVMHSIMLKRQPLYYVVGFVCRFSKKREWNVC